MTSKRCSSLGAKTHQLKVNTEDEHRRKRGSRQYHLGSRKAGCGIPLLLSRGKRKGMKRGIPSFLIRKKGGRDGRGQRLRRGRKKKGI